MPGEQRRRNVLLQTFTTGQLARQLLARELGGAGMEPDRFAVQSVVGALGPITPTELAAFLGMAPTTLSAWIRRLTDDGQLARNRNPNDGRSYHLELTPAGREGLDAALPHFAAALGKVETALGTSLVDVEEMGERYQQALRQALETTAVS